MPLPPSPVAELLSRLDAALGALGVPWFLFGAQAAAAYGAARLTADVDLTVRLGETSVQGLVSALARAGFASRVEDDPEFVERTQVLPLVDRTTGLPVDVVLAGPGLEDVMLEAAERIDVGGVVVPVARAEHLVVTKVLAGRPKDLEDVEAILSARADRFDTREVEALLGVLEKALDQQDLLPVFQRALARARKTAR